MTSTQSSTTKARHLTDRRLRNSPNHHSQTAAQSPEDTSARETIPNYRHQLLAVTANPANAARLMIVACDPTTVSDLRRQLRTWGYQQFQTTESPAEALSLLEQETPELLIVDLVSLADKGLQLLEDVRCRSADFELPILVLLSPTAVVARARALELGATDLINRPVDSAELALRVRNLLKMAQHQSRLTSLAADWEHQLHQQTEALLASRKDALQCLARAGEYRDHGTGKHVLRVSQYAGAIARELGLSTTQAEQIEDAAMLHDIGKIGISDYILLKPSRLTPAEFNVMKQHCQFGREILQPHRESSFGSPQAGQQRTVANETRDVLELAASIAMTHHEWWNGQGYPLGLAGEAIPLEGRITAVADVYDALSSRRPYKPPYSSKHCMSIMRRGRGQQFDPRVLDAFFAAKAAILEIQRRLSDTDSPTFLGETPRPATAQTVQQVEHSPA